MESFDNDEMLNDMAAMLENSRAHQEALCKQEKERVAATIAHLNSLRAEISLMEDLYTADALSLITDAMHTCASIAGEDIINRGEYKKKTELVELFLFYANHLMEFEHTVDTVQQAADNMADVLGDYPRLKLEVMRIRLQALRVIENRVMHDLGIAEDLLEEIRRYSGNIEAADRGDFDSIVDSGLLKRDPVEWTKEWEKVIDDVNIIVEERLAGQPRGMGFCHALWHERAAVLKEFGIEWRSPSVMNPGVNFD